MEAILNFDWSVFQWVEEHLWNPVLDVIMPVITHLGDSGIIWIVLGIVLLCTKKYRVVGVAVFAALAVHMAANDLILKPLFSRPRPFNLEQWQGVFNYPDLVSKPTSFSFPSGHSSSSFACAVALIMTNKKRIYIPGLVLAMLIAFSRVYVHVHYCTDIIAGSLVGIIYGLIAIFAVKKLLPIVIRKYQEYKTKRSKNNA